MRVDDALTLDLVTVTGFEGHHLAVRVDGARFDQILARLQALGDPDGHLWEVRAAE